MIPNLHILSDTKLLYGKFNTLEQKLLHDILKQHRNLSGDWCKYRFHIRDWEYGVRLWHQPKFATPDFNTMLQFHGYSNPSPLLRELFDALPLDHSWLLKKLHIAFDCSVPIESIHAVHPPHTAIVKPRSVMPFEGTEYIGGFRSPVQHCLYDKQKSECEKHGIVTGTWTRSELRFNLPRMKRISKLTMDDFKKAANYSLIMDIDALPPDQKEIVQKLNAGLIQWGDTKECPERMRKKIRKQATVNLYDCLLSAEITDLSSFIYQFESNPNHKSA